MVEPAAYGSGDRYPPCETCQAAAHPADLLLEGPGMPAHYVCIDCACLAFQEYGRFDLRAEMERQRQTIVFLRHDPKSPSYRGGL